jgi:hypothetical protein
VSQGLSRAARGSSSFARGFRRQLDHAIVPIMVIVDSGGGCVRQFVHPSIYKTKKNKKEVARDHPQTPLSSSEFIEHHWQLVGTCDLVIFDLVLDHLKFIKVRGEFSRDKVRVLRFLVDPSLEQLVLVTGTKKRQEALQDEQIKIIHERVMHGHGVPDERRRQPEPEPFTLEVLPRIVVLCSVVLGAP